MISVVAAVVAMVVAAASAAATASVDGGGDGGRLTYGADRKRRILPFLDDDDEISVDAQVKCYNAMNLLDTKRKKV